mgnify:CR=1 FL=1
MIRGMQVDVFTDPQTKRHYEGRATVRNILGEHFGHFGVMRKVEVSFNDNPTVSYCRYFWEWIK